MYYSVGLTSNRFAPCRCVSYRVVALRHMRVYYMHTCYTHSSAGGLSNGLGRLSAACPNWYVSAQTQNQPTIGNCSVNGCSGVRYPGLLQAETRNRPNCSLPQAFMSRTKGKVNSRPAQAQANCRYGLHLPTRTQKLPTVFIPPLGTTPPAPTFVPCRMTFIPTPCYGNRNRLPPCVW